MIKSDNLYVLILAAGRGERFGGPKQLAMIGRKSFIRHSIDCAAAVVPTRQIIVVTGARHQQVASEANKAGVQVVENRDWAGGIGGSVGTGVAALPAAAVAVLLMSCDQVMLSGDHLRRLLTAWDGATERIAAAAYADTIGIPVVIPAVFFPQLLALQGDSGAKQLLLQHPDALISVPMDAARYDIDSKQDIIEAGLNTPS
ncbi:MAG: nucleotidyltransferase family protein [Gammaproteobacteria bacterium]